MARRPRCDRPERLSFVDVAAPAFLIAAWLGKEPVQGIVDGVLEEWRPQQPVVVLTNAAVDSLDGGVKVADARTMSVESGAATVRRVLRDL